MNIKLAGALVALALGAGAASAQPGWYGGAPYYSALSSREVLATVRAAGLRPVTQPGRYGDTYVVYARDRHGQTKRVIVDAEFGDILRIVSVDRRPTPRHDWGPPRRWWGDSSEVAVVRPPAPVGRWRDRYDERPPARWRAAPEEADELPRTQQPAARQHAPRAAAVNPTERQPPVPRARPAVPPAAVRPAEKPAEDAQPAPAQAKASPAETLAAPPDTTLKSKPAAPVAKPQERQAQEGKPAASASPEPSKTKLQETQPQETQKRAAAPRVVYPGGPKSKEERETQGTTRGDARAETPNTAPEGGSAFPPVQPLE